MTRAGLLLAALALCGCATPITVREYPAASARPRRIALVPLFGETESEAAAELVTIRVHEALVAAGVSEVVSPAEVGVALAGAGSPDDRPEPARLAARLRGAFGADAYLAGELLRFRERKGSEEGAFRPASVAFSLELRGGRGELLWAGTYDETQLSLTEDLRYLRLAWQRGFRFVSADELARFGAGELVAQLERSAAGWR